MDQGIMITAPTLPKKDRNSSFLLLTRSEKSPKDSREISSVLPLIIWDVYRFQRFNGTLTGRSYVPCCGVVNLHSSYYLYKGISTLSSPLLTSLFLFLSLSHCSSDYPPPSLPLAAAQPRCENVCTCKVLHVYVVRCLQRKITLKIKRINKEIHNI